MSLGEILIFKFAHTYPITMIGFSLWIQTAVYVKLILNSVTSAWRL